MKSTLRLLLPMLLLGSVSEAQLPQLVYDIQSGPNGSDPVYLTPFNNRLYFTANDGVAGRELWSYDGTNPPTMVYNLNPGTASGSLLAYNQKMGLLGTKLYFAATNGASGDELFMYDGTNPPALAVDIESGAGSSSPRGFITIGNKLYFRATTAANGTELYSYDGSNPPVRFDINPGASSSSPANLTEFNGKLYFTANTAATGTELYVYDPGTNAYNIVQDINSGAPGSSPGAFSKGGNKLWFVASSASFGNELYSFDGTNVSRVTDVATGTGSGASAQSTAWFNNAVFFSGSTDGANFQLYRFDPGTGNATLVYSVNPGGSGNINSLTEYKGRLYFQGTTAAAGQEIWVTDGTTTSMVTDLNPGATGSAPSDFTEWRNVLYMNASNGSTGYELYRINDPAGIVSASFNGSIRLYPNPTSEAASLEIVVPLRRTLSIRLTDMQGREVWAREPAIFSSGRSIVQLPAAHLSAGTYFYLVSDEDGVRIASGKLVRE